MKQDQDLPIVQVPVPSTETEEFCLVMLRTDHLVIFPSRVATLDDVRRVLDAAGYVVTERP